MVLSRIAAAVSRCGVVAAGPDRAPGLLSRGHGVGVTRPARGAGSVPQLVGPAPVRVGGISWISLRLPVLHSCLPVVAAENPVAAAQPTHCHLRFHRSDSGGAVAGDGGFLTVF